MLEAIRSPAADDDVWAHGITEAIEQILTAPIGVGFQVIAHNPQFERSIQSAYAPVAMFRGHAGSHFDSVGIMAYPMPNIVVVAEATFARTVTLSPYDRRVLSRIALQLEAGYLLRKKPDSVVARVWEDGRVLPSSDAKHLWHSLVTGTRCLVERWHDNGRSYLVLENAAGPHHRRALTRGEIDVVSMAMRGLSTKVIAFDLGMTPSGVSNRLAQAATKLGVSTRTDLLRLARSLSGAQGDLLVDSALTDAERDVLSMVRCGMSNGEIAEARSRSVRTVANQVASVLRKTRSPSRRALLVAKVCDVERV